MWPSERSGSVRATTISTPALPAKVHQVLAPFSSQPPGTRVPRRPSEATSEPWSGSVMAMAHSGSPAASRGSQWACCSGVPPASSARLRISGRVIRLPAAASEASDSASVTTTISSVSSRSFGPLPPKRSGIARPKTPSSRSGCSSDSGTVRSSRWMAWASGATT